MNHREIVYKTLEDALSILRKETMTLQKRSEDPAYPDSYAIEAELEAQCLSELTASIEVSQSRYKAKEENPCLFKEIL